MKVITRLRGEGYFQLLEILLQNPGVTQGMGINICWGRDRNGNFEPKKFIWLR
jgi:hypothetical protein